LPFGRGCGITCPRLGIIRGVGAGNPLCNVGWSRFGGRAAGAHVQGFKPKGVRAFAPTCKDYHARLSPGAPRIGDGGV
jgi:hypothetical protein